MAAKTLPKPLRYTIKDFDKDFPDDEACLKWLTEYLYPNGVRCRKCKRVTTHNYLRNRKALCCNMCGAHVHPTAGTIFHKSTTSLRTWFHALFLMSATRCGISAMQLMRETGTTYKTAWRMFNKIRAMLHEDIRDLGRRGGGVEVDETYIGGRKHRKEYLQANRGGGHKAAVGGAVERGGRVSAYVMKGRGLYDLTDPVRERVLPETTIFTDEAPQYKRLTRMGMGWEHKRIYHTAKIYVRGDVHTNTIEGFWSLVKRGISGVYHSVSKKHLQGYLDEYSFRYNHRSDPWPMWQSVTAQISSDVALDRQPESHPHRVPRKPRPSGDEQPS